MHIELVHCSEGNMYLVIWLMKTVMQQIVGKISSTLSFIYHLSLLLCCNIVIQVVMNAMYVSG
jgi:hypothetical protein